MNFRRLIDDYYKMIYHISLEYLRNKEDAEDIIQDVLSKYVEYIKENGEIEDRNHEKYWIARVTINLCCNELKTARRKSAELNSNKSKTFVMKENQLFGEVQKLDDNYKSVFILHYLEEFKISEVSEILEISEECVKTRLKRTREKLKNELNIEE